MSSFWGTGASDQALNGVAPASDLWPWTSSGRVADPGGIDFAHSARQDLQLLAGHGLRTLRLPLEWARIEPQDAKLDGAAVEDMRNILVLAREANIDVWACLVDSTLPGWFGHDERGFADQRSRRYFWARHVEFVGEAFGDLVAGWVPVHEPNRWAWRGWLSGQRPPGSKQDSKGFAAALEGIQIAAVEAALRLREGGRPVATSQWVIPLFAAGADPHTPADANAEAMVSVANAVHFGSWQQLLNEESITVGHRPPVAVPGAKEAFDIIGFTYRHGAAVRGDGAFVPYPQDRPTGPDGQVMWSNGFSAALHHVADTFADRPVLVTGVGVATNREDQREQYVRDVVEILNDATDGGMDLHGAWWETPIDGAGSRAQRGLFGPDRSARPALGALSGTKTPEPKG